MNKTGKRSTVKRIALKNSITLGKDEFGWLLYHPKHGIYHASKLRKAIEQGEKRG